MHNGESRAMHKNYVGDTTNRQTKHQCSWRMIRERREGEGEGKGGRGRAGGREAHHTPDFHFTA